MKKRLREGIGAAGGEKKNTPKYSRLIENVMNIEEVRQGPEADQEGEFYHSNKQKILKPDSPPLTGDANTKSSRYSSSSTLLSLPATRSSTSPPLRSSSRTTSRLTAAPTTWATALPSPPLPMARLRLLPTTSSLAATSSTCMFFLFFFFLENTSSTFCMFAKYI